MYFPALSECSSGRGRPRTVELQGLADMLAATRPANNFSRGFATVTRGHLSPWCAARVVAPQQTVKCGSGGTGARSVVAKVVAPVGLATAVLFCPARTVVHCGASESSAIQQALASAASALESVGLPVPGAAAATPTPPTEEDMIRQAVKIAMPILQKCACIYHTVCPILRPQGHYVCSR